MPERKEPTTVPMPAQDAEGTPTPQEPTTDAAGEPQEIVLQVESAPQEVVLQVVPVAPLAPSHAAPSAQGVPTLDAAFMALCEAIMPILEEQDDMPTVYRVEEIMSWYANGNHAVAWLHVVLALEKAINVPLRGLT